MVLPLLYVGTSLCVCCWPLSLDTSHPREQSRETSLSFTAPSPGLTPRTVKELHGPSSLTSSLPFCTAVASPCSTVIRRLCRKYPAMHCEKQRHLRLFCFFSPWPILVYLSDVCSSQDCQLPDRGTKAAFCCLILRAEDST